MGEAPENCLIREFQEETSVNVYVEQILDSYLFEVIPQKHVFIVIYVCILIGVVSSLISLVHQDVGFHSGNNLENINIPSGYAGSIINWYKKFGF